MPCETRVSRRRISFAREKARTAHKTAMYKKRRPFLSLVSERRYSRIYSQRENRDNSGCMDELTNKKFSGWHYLRFPTRILLSHRCPFMRIQCKFHQACMRTRLQLRWDYALVAMTPADLCPCKRTYISYVRTLRTLKKKLARCWKKFQLMELLFRSLIRRNLLIAITLLIRAELTVAKIRRTR